MTDETPTEPVEVDRRAGADLEGELRTDELHRRLYAQDASIYEQQPTGVAYPRDAGDLTALVETARRLDLSLIPRGGGTSLAGQCVGDGLVVDIGRHMDRILEVDEEEQWARVQPGVVLDDLNRALAGAGLMFGPDTSTADQCQIGGMIGNNSCGSHSIYYGTTRDHLLEVELVLSDGSRVTVGPWDDETYREKRQGEGRLAEALRVVEREVGEHRDLIADRYPRPDLLRRNSGYALDALLRQRPHDPEGEPFSLLPLLCGSEGTLGVVAEAKLNLVERPETKLLVCAHFESLGRALRATEVAVEREPAAVELMDRRILEITEAHPEQRKNRFFVEGDPAAILVLEYYGDSREDVEAQADRAVSDLEEAGLGYAFPRVHPPDDGRVWELRKAGLGMLMGVEGDTKPVTVVEDTAVAVEDLPEYISDFSDVMERHGTQCVYYAHASVGELHLRPELDLKDREGAETFVEIAEEIAELVRSYDGSLSGEHGDGRVRSPMLEKFYGEEIVEIYRRVKGAFDPDGIFNPGAIVDPAPIDEDWRVDPGESTPEIETYFDWSEDAGLVRSVEKCNGAGVCRKNAEAGGTMCPSYHATQEELDTTRGRANVFRQLLYAEKPARAFESEQLREALDLCLSCKACKTECPAGVDMAKMKAEFFQQYYDRRGGPPRSAAFFGRFREFAELAAIWPWLVNLLLQWSLVRWIVDRWYGLAPDRELPTFAAQTFGSWFDARETLEEEQARGTVWLYVDPFTEFNEPEVGRSAVRVLEAGGFRVERFPVDDDGRTYISKGLVREARELTRGNLERLEPLLEEYPDRPIVGLEPSALLTFRDEAPDLVDEPLRGVAESVGERARLLEEFVVEASEAENFGASWAEEGLGDVHLHGHCHQKALVGTEPTERALRIAGYDVETIPSGCCGMAGSFGYEADHYEVSMEIGELNLFPAVRGMAGDAELAAPGTSCREQIAAGTDRRARHPAVLLDEALGE